MTGRCHRRWTIALVLGVMALGWWFGPAAGVADEAPAGPVPSSNPLTGDPEAIEAGHKLFNMWCAQCHGSKADGHSPVFYGYAADLRKYKLGYTEFARTVVEGRPKKRMPPWDGVLDGEQVSQIGAYLETLAIDGANWEDYE